MEGKKLTKSYNDRKVWGVCAGLSEYFDVDVTLVRLLFVIFTILGGPGVLVYLVLGIFLPESDGAANDFSVGGKRKNDQI